MDSQEKLADVLRRLAGPEPAMPRDHVPCKWCSGRGCTACLEARVQRERALDAEYQRQFPDGPKPMLSVPNTPEGLAALRKVAGREAIEKAFGPGGGGVDEIEANIEAARAAGELPAQPKN